MRYTFTWENYNNFEHFLGTLVRYFLIVLDKYNTYARSMVLDCTDVLKKLLVPFNSSNCGLLASYNIEFWPRDLFRDKHASAYPGTKWAFLAQK